MKQRAETGSLHARVASSVLPSVLMCKCALCFLYTPGLCEASKGLSADFTSFKRCSLQDVFFSFKLQQIEMAACKSVSWSLSVSRSNILIKISGLDEWNRYETL